ncbi:flagellar motor switch protein FliN [Pontibacillus chungwhensis BH030062]|uniref:Flagellar motor switch protein FliN n=1 Tax=Pontibacillus chungwhensis BH030062 TaxID=1385513 RepID=A0A0A2V271_9BACI|nr:flagellar motor switch phosphatase FliY [Pontibacillus chungwhensis]KGP92866.1 flagellar motor switch protein FliN [Pontibacillus chungwhensis BH030062]
MMSDDMLSQDEIDALLNGTADTSNMNKQQPSTEEYLSSLEQDALGEIGNISFGSSATALSSLLMQKVDITTPTISIMKRSNLADEFPEPNVAIQVEYTEGFSGMNLLVIQQSDAAIIADLMLGGDGTSPSEEMNEIHLSAVQEAMNQMMGSAATSMSTVFNKKVDISPPSIDLLHVREGEGTEQIPDEDLVNVSFQIKVGDLIDSRIMQVLPIDFARELVDQLLNPPSEEGDILDQKETQQEPKPANEIDKGSSSDSATYQQTYEDASHHQPSAHYMSQSQETPSQRETQYMGGMSQEDSSQVQQAVFSQFEPTALHQQEKRNLDMLMDIPLKVTVELGRTKRTIKDILELSSGSIVELDKLAGEPVDILVNDKPIAQGEVVVIDENFGVRVTEILSQQERLRKLQ